jgi:starvation-inducible DNA-binding protein
MNSTKETFDTRNDLPRRVRDTLIPLLNRQLAATLDLHSQGKQAHWNVKGMHFISLYLLFADLAQSLSKTANEFAGWIAALTAVHSHLAGFPPEIREDCQTVTVLAGRFAQYNTEFRAALQTAAEYSNLATADLLITISRKVEKQLWFLEAHLQMV